MSLYKTEKTEGALQFHESLAEQVHNLDKSFENYKSFPVIALVNYLPSFKVYQKKGGLSAISTVSIICVENGLETSLNTDLIVQTEYDSLTWQFYYNAKSGTGLTLNEFSYYYVKIHIHNDASRDTTLYSDYFKILTDNLTQFELYQDDAELDYFKFWKETEIYYNDSFENKITAKKGSGNVIVQRSVWDVRGLKFGANQSDINICSKINKYQNVLITDRFTNFWTVDTNEEIEQSLESILDSDFYAVNIKFKANKVITTPALDVTSSNAEFTLKNTDIGSPFPIVVNSINNAIVEQPELEEQDFRSAGKKWVETQHTFTRKKIQFWLNESDAESFVKYLPMSNDPEYKDAGGSYINIIAYDFDELKMSDVDGEDIRQIDLTFRIEQTDNYPLA